MTASLQCLISNIEILNKLECLNNKAKMFGIWCLEFSACLEIRNSNLEIATGEKTL